MSVPVGLEYSLLRRRRTGHRAEITGCEHKLARDWEKPLVSGLPTTSRSLFYERCVGWHGSATYSASGVGGQQAAQRKRKPRIAVFMNSSLADQKLFDISPRP